MFFLLTDSYFYGISICADLGLFVTKQEKVCNKHHKLTLLISAKRLSTMYVTNSGCLSNGAS
jgi:hypothetical protein